MDWDACTHASTMTYASVPDVRGPWQVLRGGREHLRLDRVYRLSHIHVRSARSAESYPKNALPHVCTILTFSPSKEDTSTHGAQHDTTRTTNITTIRRNDMFCSDMSYQDMKGSLSTFTVLKNLKYLFVCARAQLFPRAPSPSTFSFVWLMERMHNPYMHTHGSELCSPVFYFVAVTPRVTLSLATCRGSKQSRDSLNCACTNRVRVRTLICRILMILVIDQLHLRLHLRTPNQHSNLGSNQLTGDIKDLAVLTNVQNLFVCGYTLGYECEGVYSTCHAVPM